MKRFLIIHISVLAMLATTLPAAAQENEIPTINPYAIFHTPDGETHETNELSDSAPIVGQFFAQPSNADGWTANYEWRFTKETEDTPYLLRYEENTEVTFKQSGQHRIICYATFTQGNDTIAYTADYWEGMTPITCTVSVSKLEFPNAFSPNGDGINDIYKAKDSYKSLIEFRAIIFNRHGQKIFEWSNPADGWDGTHNGHPVADGVYYVQVNAKGSDGVRYNIRKDVNLLRGYNESGNTLQP